MFSFYTTVNYDCKMFVELSAEYRVAGTNSLRSSLCRLHPDVVTRGQCYKTFYGRN
jgi:hypothetical protein